MSNSARLEHDAEQTRMRLARTLDELRERITPGELVDQAFDYAKDSVGGDFVRNLGRQMADSPLPVCLMGAGLAWLVLSNGRASTSDTAGDSGDTALETSARGGETAQKAGEQVGAWAAGTRDRVADAADAAKSHIGEAAASFGQTASSAYESTKSRAGIAAGAVGEVTSNAYQRVSRATSGMAASASTAGQTAANVRRRFFQLCTEEPLVLAGIGLAIGAVFGAAAPPTDTEDRLMGKSSDQLKQRSRSVAREQFEKGKAVAASAWEETREGAEKQGLGEVPGAESKWPPAGPTLVPSADHDSSEDKRREPPFAEQPHGLE